MMNNNIHEVDKKQLENITGGEAALYGGKKNLQSNQVVLDRYMLEYLYRNSSANSRHAANRLFSEPIPMPLAQTEALQ